MNTIRFTRMKYALSFLAILSIFLTSSCSKSPSDLTEDKTQDMKIVDVIKNYLDKKELKYRTYTDNDSIQTFELVFTTKENNLLTFIDILLNDSVYNVMCRSTSNLPKAMINDAIAEVNKFNLASRFTSACVDPDGDIIFWIGTNYDGNTFSEESFAADLWTVVNAADDILPLMREQLGVEPSEKPENIP